MKSENDEIKRFLVNYLYLLKYGLSPMKEDKYFWMC